MELKRLFVLELSLTWIRIEWFSPHTHTHTRQEQLNQKRKNTQCLAYAWPACHSVWQSEWIGIANTGISQIAHKRAPTLERSIKLSGWVSFSVIGAHTTTNRESSFSWRRCLHAYHVCRMNNIAVGGRTRMVEDFECVEGCYWQYEGYVKRLYEQHNTRL